VSPFRIALANLRYPASPGDSVAAAGRAIAEAGHRGAGIVCFPECFVPGYRWPGRALPPPDRRFLDEAWQAIGQAAAKARVAVVLGTERFEGEALRLTAVVFDDSGTVLGWQDKVQLDPTEDPLYEPGVERRVFTAGPLTFGIAICHEGFRYPETVRWAVRRGAQLVFHPHYTEAEPGSFRPSSYADPRNTFHEAAALCRAAENGCYYATVNCAGDGSPTTSAVVNPDGTLLACQPYGDAGLLVVDIDLARATRLLARRLREEAPLAPSPY
jgi:predicted amidohydrolase